MYRILISLISGICFALACSGEPPVSEPARVEVVDVYSHPSAGAPVGVVYLKAINQGGSADRLVSVTADIATSAELHETIENDGRMKMIHHPAGFAIAPGSELTLTAGGKHIMLTGLAGKLEAGSTFNLELLFEQTGTVKIAVPIRPRSY